jgi:acyl-CoA synthetase (AMP-forming)/AMP-acid ligase II
MLSAIIQRHAIEEPEGIAVIDAAGAHTWRTLAARSDALAQQIQSLPFVRFATVLPQRADALALVAAVASRGAELLVLAETHGPERVRSYARDLGAEAIVDVRGPALSVEPLEGVAPAAPPERAADPAVYLLTSGTSGRPKCAKHTWTSLSRAVKLRDSGRGQRWLLGYPMAQFAGLQVVLQSLHNGGTLVVPRDFSPPRSIEAVIDRRVECITCTPTAARLMLACSSRPLLRDSAVRHVTLGGEAVDQRTIDELRDAFPSARIACTYASTKLGLLLVASDGKAGFDPTAIDGERFKLDGGELFARRTARAMMGYVGRQGASSETERVNQSGQDSWASTGDLAEVRGDRLFILGRKDDVINVGGFKVVPAQVEETIRSVRGVVEAAVVAHRSSILGNLVKARVRLTDDADATRVVADVRRTCADALPYYMVPRLIEVTDSLAMNASQKIVRRAEP